MHTRVFTQDLFDFVNESQTILFASNVPATSLPFLYSSYAPSDQVVPPVYIPHPIYHFPPPAEPMALHPPLISLVGQPQHEY